MSTIISSRYQFRPHFLLFLFILYGNGGAEGSSMPDEGIGGADGPESNFSLG